MTDRLEALIDAGDDARKRRREAGIPNPLNEAWKAEQRVLAAERGACPTSPCILPVGHDGGHYFVNRGAW